MKKIVFALLMSFFAVGAIAQELDLSKQYIRIESEVMQEPGDVVPEGIAHYIEINTIEKTIKVTRKGSQEVVIYELEYTTSYNGTSRSVQMKPGETLFMIRDSKIVMVAYSQNEHTFSFIDGENKIQLFGQLYILE